MITLAGAALGLVCALAWNDAIKAAMKYYWEDESIPGLFIYAALATLVAVITLIVLGKIAGKIGGEAAISREAEG